MTGTEELPDHERFVGAVASALRALGYQVEGESSVTGTRFDLIASQPAPGVGPTRVAVECKHHGPPQSRNVGKQEVAKFVQDMLLSGRTFDFGLLVTNNGFTPSARAAQQGDQRVRLATLGDLHDELFNPAHMLLGTVSEYAGTDMFTGFVDLAISERRLNNHSDEPHPSVIDRLLELAHERQPTVALLLGDFGAGKTTVLEHLRYRISRDSIEGYGRGQDRLPLIFQLRNLRSAANLEGFIRSEVFNQTGRDIASRLFWSQLSSGRFIPLLDGFDEMVGGADPAERIELLHGLSPLLRGPNLSAISCRPGYFSEVDEYNRFVSSLENLERLADSEGSFRRLRRPRSDWERQLDDALIARHAPPREPQVHLSRVHTMSLLPMDRDQILNFIEAYSPSMLEELNTTAVLVFDFLKSVYDLSDLMERPLLMCMILDSIKHGAVKIDQSSPVKGGASGLYERYTSVIMRRDWVKREAGASVLSPSQRQQVATACAFLVVGRKQLVLNRQDLSYVVGALAAVDESFNRRVRSAGVSAVLTDVATCAFIIGNAERGFRFAHNSFAEFFVAQYMADSMLFPARTQSIEIPDEVAFGLDDRVLPAAVLYFLGGFLSMEGDLRRHCRSLIHSLGSDASPLRVNLEGAMLRSGPEVRDLEVSGSTHSGVRLRRVKIADSRFLGTRFSWPDIAELGLESGEYLMKFHGGNVRALTVGPMATGEFSFADVDLIDLVVTADVHIALRGMTANGCTIAKADVRVSLEEALWKSVEVSDARLSVDWTGSSTLSALWSRASDVRLGENLPSRSPMHLTDVQLEESVLRVGGPVEANAGSFANVTIIIERGGRLRMTDCSMRDCEILDLSGTESGIVLDRTSINGCWLAGGESTPALPASSDVVNIVLNGLMEQDPRFELAERSMGRAAAVRVDDGAALVSEVRDLSDLLYANRGYQGATVPGRLLDGLLRSHGVEVTDGYS